MSARSILMGGFLLLSACSAAPEKPSEPAATTDQQQFLTDNAAREGVTVTESGLQYEVLRTADGPRPTEESTVTLDYVGTLTDGTRFDDSYKHGKTPQFTLGGAIPGFVEGVQLMNEGACYRIVVPPELAYGDRGAGTKIGPGDVLIYDVELHDVK